MNKTFRSRCQGIILGAATPLLATLGQTASAQLTIPPPGFSRASYAYVEAGDLNPSGGIYEYPFVDGYGDHGQYVSGSGSMSFTGMDSNGDTQTMTMTGSSYASTDFNQVHAYATATLTNPYYNENNPIYYNGTADPNPAGSPRYLQAVGQAVWQDTLNLNRFADGVVGLRYVFHVEGNNTDDHAYAFLSFDVNQYNATFFATDHGANNAVWATPTWNVTAGSPIYMQGNFGAVAGFNVRDFTPEGIDASGTADFGNTLDLATIDLLDANGNVVNGVEYSTASGTHYNITGGVYVAATPSPSSCLTLLLGLGAMTPTILSRRRRRKA